MYLKDPSEGSLSHIPDVNDVIARVFQLLQLGVQLRRRLVVRLVLRQFVEVDGGGGGGGRPRSDTPVLGDGALVAAGLGTTAQPIADQNWNAKIKLAEMFHLHLSSNLE